MEYTKALIKGKKEGSVRTFQISDQTVDRDKEVVVTKDVDTTEFEKNAIIMYAHAANRIPNPDLVVGKAVKIWKEDLDTAPKLLSDAKFDVDGKADVSNALAKKVLYKYDNGFLNTASIGFGSDKDTRGFGVKSKGEDPSIYYHRNTVLHEWSSVPVPSNSNALIQRSFERSLMHNVDEWLQFIDKEGLKGDDLDLFIKSGLEGAPDLLYLDNGDYTAPSAVTFHFGGESKKEDKKVFGRISGRDIELASQRQADGGIVTEEVWARQFNKQTINNALLYRAARIRQKN